MSDIGSYDPINPARDTVRVKRHDDAHRVTRDDGSQGNKFQEERKKFQLDDQDTLDINPERSVPVDPHDDTDIDETFISLKSIRASMVKSGVNPVDPTIDETIDPKVRAALTAYEKQAHNREKQQEEDYHTTNDPMVEKIDDLLEMGFDRVPIEDNQSYQNLIEDLWSRHVVPKT